MTDHDRRRPPMKPLVCGVPVLPESTHGLGSPHVELLARIAVGGGTLTAAETREVCAAVLAYLSARRLPG